MSEGKGKQPSLIMDQEITTKSGQVIMQRFGAMFQREDGSHEMTFESFPMKGASVARTPEQRMERLKQLGLKSPKTKRLSGERLRPVGGHAANHFDHGGTAATPFGSSLAIAGAPLRTTRCRRRRS